MKDGFLVRVLIIPWESPFSMLLKSLGARMVWGCIGFNLFSLFLKGEERQDVPCWKWVSLEPPGEQLRMHDWHLLDVDTC